MNSTSSDGRPDGGERNGGGAVRHRHPFAMIPLWVVQRVESHAAIRVYLALASFASGAMGDDRSAYPSAAQIAERAGMTTDRVYKNLRLLRDAGAITVVPHYREDGGRGTNDYVLEAVPPEARLDHQALSAQGGLGADDPDPSRRSAHRGRRDKEEQTTTKRNPSPRTRDEGEVVTAPKLVRIDGRDLAFDALAAVCGVDPSGNRAREVATALNGSPRGMTGIRTLVARDMALPRGGGGDLLQGEQFERTVASLIMQAAERYRARFGPDVTMTPMALAKWWTDLSHWPYTSGAADAARIAQEELTR